MKNKIDRFHHKLKFEHWPWKVVYFPVFVKYLGYSILEGNPFYFYATNPGIETGGLLIESKYDILKKIPRTYLPETALVDLSKIKLTKFPVIIKPNFGERGVSVEKIESQEDFKRYKKNNPHDREYIVQEYVDYPLELGVFYYFDPKTKQGNISSVTIKEFLSVTGNGKSTIKELMEQNFRAEYQLERLSKSIDIKQVPKKGEKIELEPIGNHNRGTTFLNGEHLITDKLIKVFDELSKQIEGFHYGRFDLRGESMEEIYKGNFKVLELNGAKSETNTYLSPKVSNAQSIQIIISSLENHEKNCTT